MNTQTSAVHTYVVGLPVCITVTGDQVVATVDLREAGPSLWEDCGVEERSEYEVKADVAAVEVAFDIGAIEVEAMFLPVPPEVIVTDVEDEACLTCPLPGCLGDSFYEVDRSERWNEIEIDGVQGDEGYVYGDRGGAGWGVVGTGPNPLAGLPVVAIHQGDGNYDTVGFQCQSCGGRVDLPEWIERSWS